MAHKQLGFMQLTIIIGFSLFYAWYLVTFFGFFATVPAGRGFTEMHIGQILFFASSIIATGALLVIFKKRDSVALGHTRFLYLLSLIPGSLTPVCGIVSALTGYLLPMPVFYVTDCLGGIAAAVGFMLWEDLSLHGYLNRGVLAHGTIFCTGGVVFLACTALLTPPQLCIAAECLLVASTALLAFIAPRCDTLENKPVQPVREFFRKTWYTEVVIIVINTAFGFAFILLYQMGSTILLAVMGIAICMDLAFSILLGRGKWIPFAGTVRICAGFVACALLLFVVPGDVTQRVALCTIVAFWFAFRTVNGGSITDLAIRNGYSMLYCATRGKVPANVGFTLGLVLGLVAVTCFADSAAHFYIPLVLTALFILTALFLLPFDTQSDQAGFKTIALVDMHEPSDTLADDMDAICERMTGKFKLSPREAEVLAYVVRGRNAKHVAEKLFISESTAKTHIANIYRKANVHSQQELLDLLEAL